MLVTDNTFLTDEVSSQFADLIFECALRIDSHQKVWVSLLWEHKSSPEKYALIQVGQYLLGGYRKQVAGKSRPIRLIVPILYYHGIEDWDPGKIEDLLPGYPEDLKVFIPDFDYIFQNITLLSDEEIQDLENNILVPGLLIQKYFKDLKRLAEFLEVIFYNLSLMNDEGNYKKNYFVYLYDLFDDKKDELMKHIDELEYPVRDKSKNYILQLEQEGFEKGFEKAIIKLLKKGSSVAFISDVMEVAPEDIARIKASMDV